MRLTEVQIHAIEKYLEKDGIFYDDIRMELTDHIATTLEEQLQEGDDFESALKTYMHSHLKVKLLTAAREQEVLRDKQNRNYMLRQFITPKGILLLIFVTTIVFAGKLNIWIERFYELIFLVLLVRSAFLYKREGKRQTYFGRVIEITQFFYVFPCLLVMQSHRVFGETDFLANASLVAMSIILTGFYLTYKSSGQLKNKKYV